MANEPARDEKVSTEEKFKEAARVVFMKKGYSATKTRDIAEEAGLNLALLNYYFRSKEKLFEIIMLEKVQQLFAFIGPVFNDAGTTLHQKIDTITERYIDMLLVNPDLPIFVLSEVRNNPERFGRKIQLDTYILKSCFIKQLVEARPDVNPMQLFLSFMGMLVFPFVTKPVFQATGALNEDLFRQLMHDRKVLVAQWMKNILED